MWTKLILCPWVSISFFFFNLPGKKKKVLEKKLFKEINAEWVFCTTERWTFMAHFWVNFSFSCLNIFFFFFFFGKNNKVNKSTVTIEEQSWKSETSSAKPKHQRWFMFHWCGTHWKLGWAPASGMQRAGLGGEQKCCRWVDSTKAHTLEI